MGYRIVSDLNLFQEILNWEWSKDHDTCYFEHLGTKELEDWFRKKMEDVRTE